MSSRSDADDGFAPAGGRKIPVAVVLGLLLSAATLVYWPGLQSVFVLDDYQNLKALQDIRPRFWIEDALGYITSGVAGPLGRYLPLASFAIQYQAWPSDPAAFKLVNLAIHLAIGLLLFVLWRIVGICSGQPEARARTLALIAAGIWLLHPVNVSTVLYVVQRMTQLAALFSVAGLVCYVYGRVMLSEGRSGGWWLTSMGLAVGTLLAAASKETGLLLPLFALASELTLLRRLRKPRGWGLWLTIFLVAPLVSATGYVALRFESWILPTYALRDFTPAERLLTEARVLMDYLRALIMPTPAALGLFRDDYIVSRSLFDPPGTLPAVLTIVSLMAVGIWLRRTAPAASFAILWYFGGHVMESTIIPLELYFQHRNYLPGAGLIFGLTVASSDLLGRLRAPSLRVALRGTGLLWLILVGSITVLETRLWGNPLAQAAAWARERPGSVRAQEWLGNVYAMTGNYPEAAQAFRRLAEGGLRHAPAYVSWAKVACYDSRVDGPAPELASQALRNAAFSKSALSALEQLVIAREAGECDRLSHDALYRLLYAVLENPELGSRMAPAVFGLIGRLQAADGRVDQALASWDRAYALQPSVELALRQARLLIAHERHEEALAYLARARTAPVPGSQRASATRRIDDAEREAKTAVIRRRGG